MPAASTLEFQGRRVPVYRAPARTILSQTSGFLAEAGFTHSLTPARNCVYGCSYCYVPTLGIYGGLKPVDWQRWGRHTTYKENAAALLRRQLRPQQRIYCSPLVDPYQPAERSERAMPELLRALAASPPAVFVLQTRSALVLEDLGLLRRLACRTQLRISFSLTTNRDGVRRLYEPLCETVEDRVDAIRALEEAGLAVHCTLAPVLPCDPEVLADLALRSTSRAVIADPLHSRAGKPRGATTRPQAVRVSRANGFEQWHDPRFQASVLEAIRARVEAAGRRFGVGPAGFSLLSG